MQTHNYNRPLLPKPFYLYPPSLFLSHLQYGTASEGQHTVEEDQRFQISGRQGFGSSDFAWIRYQIRFSNFFGSVSGFSPPIPEQKKSEYMTLDIAIKPVTLCMKFLGKHFTSYHPNIGWTHKWHVQNRFQYQILQWKQVHILILL